MSWRKCGFTLIELLIVVAIIAILAAIAVPNFLEAQVRAKVSRVKTDMRTCTTALEMYVVDWNVYPPPYGYDGELPDGTWEAHEPCDDEFDGFMSRKLTSPIAYVTALPNDVFKFITKEHPALVPFHYSNQRTYEEEDPDLRCILMARYFALTRQMFQPQYSQFSYGPCLKYVGAADDLTCQEYAGKTKFDACLYDPTNGTTSLGNIYSFGPGGLIK